MTASGWRASPADHVYADLLAELVTSGCAEVGGLTITLEWPRQVELADLVRSGGFLDAFAVVDRDGRPTEILVDNVLVATITPDQTIPIPPGR